MGQRDLPIRKLTGHEEGPECPSSTGFREHTKCAPTYGLGEEAVEWRKQRRGDLAAGPGSAIHLQ